VMPAGSGDITNRWNASSGDFHSSSEEEHPAKSRAPSKQLAGVVFILISEQHTGLIASKKGSK